MRSYRNKLKCLTSSTWHLHIIGYVVYVSEVGGSETNREIDFGFGSCVRARALVVRWEFGQILTCPLSLFPFPPVFSQRPLSIFPFLPAVLLASQSCCV